MRYAGVAINDINEFQLLEHDISKWYANQHVFYHSSTSQKYWTASIQYPFAKKNHMFYVILRYFEEVEKSDCLMNIASAFQISEIYLKYKKLPGLIRQAFRIANQKLKEHLLSEYPMLGRFTTFALVEREPLIRKIS